MDQPKLQVGIIGSAGGEEYPKRKPAQKVYKIAKAIGQMVAEKGAVVICGGKGGIMESACQGAKDAKGITVGVVAGNNRGTCNKFVDVEVVSGAVNCSEESLIVSMSDALIIIGGGAGTLQEITTAYRNNKPMVAITCVDGWGKKLANTYLDDRKKIKILSAQTPQQAIDLVFGKLLSSERNYE